MRRGSLRQTEHRRAPRSALEIALVGSALLRGAFAQEVIEVVGPDADFDIDDSSPVGLRDIASVFPFAGPFAADDEGSPGDGYLHDVMGGIDRTFADQLLPVLRARYVGSDHPCDKDVQTLCPHSDAPLHCLGQNKAKMSKGCVEEIRHAVPFVCSAQIGQFCGDSLYKGVIPCLEEHGAALGQDCADAIVAAKHTLASLSGSINKRKLPSKPSAATPPPNAAPCPPGWDGPKAKGCCTRRWTADCDVQCSAEACAKQGPGPNGWEFRWQDFRTRPFACCPRRPGGRSGRASERSGCPAGWKPERKGTGCCRRAWSWDCGQGCAEDQCASSKGFVWADVDVTKEPYRCCAGSGGNAVPKTAPDPPRRAQKDALKKPAAATDAPGPNPANSADGIPDAPGSSWVSDPWTLSSPPQWAMWATATGSICVICTLRRLVAARDDTFKEL